jgi:hypothetical protein
MIGFAGETPRTNLPFIRPSRSSRSPPTGLARRPSRRRLPRSPPFVDGLQLLVGFARDEDGDETGTGIIREV